MTSGTAIFKRLGQDAGSSIFEEDAAMNIHTGIETLKPSSAAKPSFLRRILTFLAKLLASPKGDQGGGDQGGWEGGARGL